MRGRHRRAAQVTIAAGGRVERGVNVDAGRGYVGLGDAVERVRRRTAQAESGEHVALLHGRVEVDDRVGRTVGVHERFEVLAIDLQAAVRGQRCRTDRRIHDARLVVVAHGYAHTGA